MASYITFQKKETQLMALITSPPRDTSDGYDKSLGVNNSDSERSYVLNWIKKNPGLFPRTHFRFHNGDSWKDGNGDAVTAAGAMLSPTPPPPTGGCGGDCIWEWQNLGGPMGGNYMYWVVISNNCTPGCSCKPPAASGIPMPIGMQVTKPC